LLDILFSDEEAIREWLENLAGDLLERLKEDKENGNRRKVTKLKVSVEPPKGWKQKTGGNGCKVSALVDPFNYERYAKNQGHILLADIAFDKLEEAVLEKGVQNAVGGISLYGEFV